MKIKKYIEYITENKKISESDIEEFIREEWDIAKDNIFLKISTKFPLDSKKISDDQQIIIDKLINKLIEIYSDVVIDNISTFDKSWDKADKIKEGDIVVDSDGVEYFVSRFGDSNNFYDSEKNKFVSLDEVKLKK